jgi:ubiquinone/menaquinone biosynthesis C-methylase UbiE
VSPSPAESRTAGAKPVVKRRLFARLYDIAMAAAEQGGLARWRQSVVSPAQGRILEIGAGTGLNFSHYRAGGTVIATEPNSAMLGRAKVRVRRARAKILLVAADAQTLPFRENTFDTAIVGLALCTIPRPRRALAELRRVLRGGASLRLLEHVRVAEPVVARLQDWLTPFWRRIAGGCRLNRRTTEVIAASGFVIESMTPHAGGLVVEIVASIRRGAPGPAATADVHALYPTSNAGLPYRRKQRERQLSGVGGRAPLCAPSPTARVWNPNLEVFDICDPAEPP